jgi:HD-GYP domain-containing protein (c-di-GMP phosphodiesterase class II)
VQRGRLGETLTTDFARRWNGRRGDPVGARIICVCDAFDAMLADRPYSPPSAVADALAELRRCAGTQFDPNVVEHFAAVLARRADLVAVV